MQQSNVGSINLREHYDFVPHNGSATRLALRMDDLLVFFALESLGTLAIAGNACLIVVLLRNKYLHRASFVLMLSLALADVLHGLVTTSFFYPPILLRKVIVPPLGVRIFNVLDWTAWSITLTHMSAICLDRLVAIMLYGRYNQLITVQRARMFTLCCWAAFLAMNSALILFQFCCLITPLSESQFYTFGYGEFESKDGREAAPLGGANLFFLMYTPLEVATLAVLSISNPITLVQLYRRHKRKMALKIQHSSASTQAAKGLGDAMIRRASTMLLEMSMRMGSKHVNSEVREMASRRANRQQQRILLQISVVAIIFYLYMSVYYLLYHVLHVSNKWVVLFNSFFYSTTHMINPVIYFSLNKDMRAQLIRAIADCLNWVCCVGSGAGFGGNSSIYGRGGGGKRAHTGEQSSSASVLKTAQSPKNSIANHTGSWSLRTYRLPTQAQKCGWLLSPDAASSHSAPASERTALLPAAPPPSISPSFIHRSGGGGEVEEPHIQHHDANNNGVPLNNNVIAPQERAQIAELARTLIEIAADAEASARSVQRELSVQSLRPFPRSDHSLGAGSSSGGERHGSLGGFSSFLTHPSSGSPLRELSGSIALIDDGEVDAQLQLDELVESHNVENDDEMDATRHKDTLERLYMKRERGRRLGSFLAERLAVAAERNERQALKGRRQRNALLDALIGALSELEEHEIIGTGRNNGLLSPEQARRKKSHSMDLGRGTGAKSSAVSMPNGNPYEHQVESVELRPRLLSASSGSGGRSVETADEQRTRRRSATTATQYALLRESDAELGVRTPENWDESSSGDVIFL